MKVQTEVGEYEQEEIVRGFVLWKNLIQKANTKRWEKNQTEEGKAMNRARSKAYYERNKEKVLAKRKADRNRSSTTEQSNS